MEKRLKVIVHFLGNGELLLLYSPSDPFGSEDEEEKMDWSVNLGGVSSLYDDLDPGAASVQEAARSDSRHLLPPPPPPRE
jgi:hypothetical protein